MSAKRPEASTAPIPPYNLEAEFAVLGSMLFGGSEAVDESAELLNPEAFYRESHGEIFATMLALAAKSSPLDIVTLKAELTARGTLQAVGGEKYIVNYVSDTAFTASNLKHYAGIVAECARRRRLIEECRFLMVAAYGPQEDSPDLIEDAERRIFALAESKNSRSDFGTSLRSLLSDTLQMMDDQANGEAKITGISTGFPELDFGTSGLQGGDLVIIAGRPSMGKSALASDMFVNIAAQGLSPVLFSLEMNRRQIGMRIVCSQSRVNSHMVRTGLLGREEWRRLQSGVESLWQATGLIDDNDKATVDYMRRVCRRHKAKHGLDAIFVDYLQLMHVSGFGNGNKNEEVGIITSGLKNLAREMDCPVIALAQLSRAVEMRQDKRPLLSDLRDSGNIEQDADVVFFPYRAMYYAPTTAEKADPHEQERAEIIIAKQRMGERNISVPIGFTPAYVRFDNLAPDVPVGF